MLPAPERESRYTRIAMALHWTMAMLVLGAAGLALFREAFARLSVDMIGVHKQVGLAILVLAFVRWWWRLHHRPPPLPSSVGRGERGVAQSVHWLIYGLLVGVPVSGWIFTSAAPPQRPLDYRGPDTIPDLPIRTDDGLAFAWHEAHELMGFALIGLFLLHIAGVIRNHLRCTPLVSRMAGPGWPRWLAGLTILGAGFWLCGLMLDLFDVRLMG